MVWRAAASVATTGISHEVYRLVTNISYFPHKYCGLRRKQLAISDLVSGHHVQMTVVGGENQIAVDGRSFHDGDVVVLISVVVTT